MPVDKISCPGGEFNIERPDIANVKTIRASYFGMSPLLTDNTDGLRAAAQYLKDNPGTALFIDGGNYRFSSPGGVDFDGCENIVINGNGSVFTLSQPGGFARIKNCFCLEIKDLTVDWDGEGAVADPAKVKNVQSGSLCLEFFEKDEISKHSVLAGIQSRDTYFDSVYFTDGDGKITGIEKIGADTLRLSHNGCLSFLRDGMSVTAFHYRENTAVFEVTEKSENITFGNVAVLSCTGRAFSFSGGASHFQLLHCAVGETDAEKRKHLVSSANGGVYIDNAKGFFHIEDSDFSFTAGTAVTVRTEAKCENAEKKGALTAQGVIKNNSVFCSGEAGIELKAGFCLCSGNRLCETRGDGIKISAYKPPEEKNDEPVVSGIKITGNIFEKCGASPLNRQVSLVSEPGSSDSVLFKDIEITANTFTSFTGGILYISFTDFLTFKGNSITAGERKNRIEAALQCGNVDISSNDFTGAYAALASVVKTGSFADFLKINGK
ncbi:MAG: hypothetical protein K6B52_05290 [Clostridiales bacterium]|nr:hypothetical protein [Clostridiales bacterium]